MTENIRPVKKFCKLKYKHMKYEEKWASSNTAI